LGGIWRITYLSFNKAHYRVDKMADIELLDESRILPNENFDLGKYVKPVFDMFDGEITEVSMKFHNSLVGVVIDRFGKDVLIIKSDEEHFITRVSIAVSPTFLSWIIGFGSYSKVISPEWVADEVYKMAYAAITGWIEDNGYRIIGSEREIYLKGEWNSDSPEEYVTEIQFPVEKV
jgi:hypothetical protein